MILYFKPEWGDKLKATQFEEIVGKLSLEVNFLEERDLEETVENLLLGHRGQSEGSCHACDGFVLFDLEDEVLDELLALMREAGLRLPLKARTTPSNVKWSLEELIRHVSEEAEVMQALHKLHQLVSATDEFTKEPHYQEDAWQTFEEEKEKAKTHFDKIGQEEISLEETLALIERFNQAVLQLIGEV